LQTKQLSGDNHKGYTQKSGGVPGLINANPANSTVKIISAPGFPMVKNRKFMFFSRLQTVANLLQHQGIVLINKDFKQSHIEIIPGDPFI
jgi:hypothetical protein